MKKIISLALAAGLLVGASAEVKAAEVTAFGMISTVGTIVENGYYTEAGAEEINPAFWVEERVELGLRIKASDTISGQVRLRMPNLATWGGADSATTSNVLDSQVRLREAFIKLPVAMFDTTVGYQFYGLPKVASGHNPIDAGFNPMPGIKASADFGMVTPTIGWIAVRDSYAPSATTPVVEQKSNVFYVMAPIALADGMKLSPWVTFNEVQGIAQASTTTMGASFDAIINNMSAGAGAIYVMDDVDTTDTSMAFAANFAINLGAVTPGIAVWYGMSGDVAPAFNYAGNLTGTWAGFNGSSTAMGFTQNTHLGYSLGAIHAHLGLNPFNTLAVVANAANIQAGPATLGVNLAYVMGTKETAEGVDTPSGLEINISSYVPLTQGVHFGLTAGYAMPLVDTIASGDNSGAGFGVGARLAMNF